MCWAVGGYNILEPPGISVSQESMLTQLVFHKICRNSLGHGQLKTQKNQIRPGGSHDKKNCHPLANPVSGSMNAFLDKSPDSQSW